MRITIGEDRAEEVVKKSHDIATYIYQLIARDISEDYLVAIPRIKEFFEEVTGKKWKITMGAFRYYDTKYDFTKEPYEIDIYSVGSSFRPVELANNIYRTLLQYFRVVEKLDDSKLADRIMAIKI